MLRDLSIDIETLGTGPRAVILSVGLAWFDFQIPDVIVEPYAEIYPRIEEQQKLGRYIDFSTVCWWMDQSQEAKKVFDDYIQRIPLLEAASRIGAAVNQANTIWAKGPDFDCVIANDLMRQVIPGFRWPFWKNRCVRTLCKLVPSAGLLQQYTVAHSALGDAIHQANQMREAARYLQGMKDEQDNLSGV